MAELIEGFTEDALRRITACWAAADASLSERMQGQLDDLRRFYHGSIGLPATGTLEPAGAESASTWSSRLWGLASRAFERIDRAYDVQLRHAVTEAIRTGEVMPEPPVEDVAGTLSVTLLSCAPITQDSGRFGGFERMFAALQRLVVAAWGRGTAGP